MTKGKGFQILLIGNMYYMKFYWKISIDIDDTPIWWLNYFTSKMFTFFRNIYFPWKLLIQNLTNFVMLNIHSISSKESPGEMCCRVFISIRVRSSACKTVLLQISVTIWIQIVNVLQERINKLSRFHFKCPLSGLRQFLETECPLKMMKNAF